MSRLYYDKPATSTGLMRGKGAATKEYLEKVAKLIPSEIVAGYMTIIGVVPSIGIIPKTELHWF